MTSFTVEAPADPKWLHVARASALAGASSMPGADVDYLDDAMLAIGESVLEVTVCPGVSRLSVRVEVADERFVVDIAGRGDVIEYDEGDGLFEMLLEGLVDNRDIRRGDQEYRVHLVLNAPVDVA